MPTNFEVHTLRGGVWQIDSTYQQREPAIEIAKQLYGEKRFEAIKVIKDDFDPKTNKGKEIVIYDTAKPQAERKAPPPKDEPKATGPDQEGGCRVQRHGTAEGRGQADLARYADYSGGTRAARWPRCLIRPLAANRVSQQALARTKARAPRPRPSPHP